MGNDIPVLDGITARTISSDRLSTRVLFCGNPTASPVLMLHGNLSTATWWEETMLALPEEFRAIAPDQRGFGAADPLAKVDARRGMGDLADDAIALMDTLGIDDFHLVGLSLGGSVVWRLMIDHASRLRSVTQISPGSPYGFGGTKDVAGAPCYDDYAGSGAGLINPEVVRLIAAGDQSMDSPFCLRSALRQLVYKPPFVPAREDALVASALTVHLGDQDYPGDAAPSPNWPFAAPGQWGVNNALSPKYAGDVSRLWQVEPRPPLLWVRGSHDLTVSDQAAADPGTLGAMGLIPNWPGPDEYPSQPMLSQTRHVLDQYRAAGGHYQEVVIDGTAHVPHIEDPQTFHAHFHQHLRHADRPG